MRHPNRPHRWRAAAAVPAAVVLCGLPVASQAEATLRYNYPYVCTRGLRIVVGHCRRDSDMPNVAPTRPEDDFCQVYYPDRPRTGGIEAMEIVLRSDLIQSLEACGAFGTAAPAQASSKPAPAAAPSAATAPAGRPAIQPMPIGPELCPLLRRLEGLAREDFRSIDRGPDRAAGKDAAEAHRTSMPIPGASCSINHSPGVPVSYACVWPQTTEKEVDQQFVNMVKALEKCMGGTVDWTMFNDYQMADVTVKARGVDYQTFILMNFLALDVRMATP